MRGVGSYAAVLGVVMSLAGPVSAQTVLEAEVIRQSFAGNTGDISGQSGTVFVYWATDGTQRMHNLRLGMDTGVWRVTPEGEFCGKWTLTRQGAEVCAPVLDLGGGQYQWGTSKFRILPGNPKGL